MVRAYLYTSMLLFLYTLLTAFVLKRVFHLKSWSYLGAQLVCLEVAFVVGLLATDLGFLAKEDLMLLWERFWLFPLRALGQILLSLGIVQVVHCDSDSDSDKTLSEGSVSSYEPQASYARFVDRQLRGVLRNYNEDLEERQKLISFTNRLKIGRTVQVNPEEPRTENFLNDLDFILGGIAKILPNYFHLFDFPVTDLMGRNWDVYMAAEWVPRRKRRFTQLFNGDYDLSALEHSDSDLSMESEQSDRSYLSDRSAQSDQTDLD